MLSTAARDGTIRVWDTRVKGYADVDIEGASAVGAVNHIKNAHGVRGKTAKGVRPPFSRTPSRPVLGRTDPRILSYPQQRSATRSVTSVAYMYHQENLLASAGSADGCVSRSLSLPALPFALDRALSSTCPS